MKMKPIVTDWIQTNHTSYTMDLALETNVIFIAGDSGTGRSVVYSLFQELAAENKNIICFNYLDWKKKYKTTIKQSKGKLFAIDNADMLLDDATRWHIGTDVRNQYIIFGRNPAGLVLDKDEIMELDSKTTEGKTTFFLKHVF